MVQTDIPAEEVEFYLQLVQNFCPFSATHLADYHSVKVFVWSAWSRGLYAGIKVTRKAVELSRQTSIILYTREQYDADQVLSLEHGPSLK